MASGIHEHGAELLLHETYLGDLSCESGWGAGLAVDSDPAMPVKTEIHKQIRFPSPLIA